MKYLKQIQNKQLSSLKTVEIRGCFPMYGSMGWGVPAKTPCAFRVPNNTMDLGTYHPGRSAVK
jgi:hypothetical protein